MHFLVIYDRAAGKLLRPEQEFVARDEAMKARFESEQQHRGDNNVEAVVLDAPSAEALRRTHARYFKTLSELGNSESAPPPPGRHTFSVPSRVSS